MIEHGISTVASLEARDAALFVQEVSKFSSEVKIKSENYIINAKSIMGVISLGILEEQTVRIIADGNDEKEAITAIKNFFSNLK